MPIRLVVFLVSLGLLWRGGQGVLTALTSRAPATAACAEHGAGRVDSKWLELRDCLAYLPEGSHFYRENGDPHAAAEQIYVPLYVPGGAETDKAHVVMATRDPALLAIYNGFPHAADGEAQRAYVEQHAARMAEVRTVRGLVRHGIDLDERERGLLAGDGVADDFIIVDEGTAPSMGMAFLALLGGLALAVGVLGSLLLRREPGAARPA